MLCDHCWDQMKILTMAFLKFFAIGFLSTCAIILQPSMLLSSNNIHLHILCNMLYSLACSEIVFITFLVCRFPPFSNWPMAGVKLVSNK